MDLKKLHHCVTVADLGSFTRAASVLSVPQSVLSRQVRDVEQAIGLTLLHRTGRGASLTEAGRRMLPKLRALVSNWQHLQEEARQLQGPPSGLIRLGVLTSLGGVLLTPLLNLACERLPDVRIHVLEGLTEHLDEALISGRLDIGLLYHNRQVPSPTDESLLQTDLCLIGPAGDSITQAEVVDFRRVAELPLILPATPNRMRLLIDQVCHDHGIVLNVTTVLDALGTLKDIAASGRAYTILPPHFVAADIVSGRLQAARIIRPAITRTILLASSAHSPMERARSEVMDLIREVISTLVTSGELPGQLCQPMTHLAIRAWSGTSRARAVAAQRR
ncbi:MAG: LysR family transcriptional regulator [Nitrobacter sp.]